MGTKWHLLRLLHLLFDEPTAAGAIIISVFLQDALTGLIADRAIKRVVDQDELQYAFASLLDLGDLGGDHHAIGHNRRAGGHWFRNFLYLHQAHTAVGFDLQLRMITEIRDLDPQPFSGLDEVRPRLYRDV